MNTAAILPLTDRDDDSELARLRHRVAELTRERDQLLAAVDILREITSSLHFTEILQHIARRLGDLYGLDRCSIYLAGEVAAEVRLVATYEDPSLSNLVVDLARYPELERAFASGQTVYIPDAATDPLLQSVRPAFGTRQVQSIVVVPIRWRTDVIGAVFLRTEADGTPFSDADIRFCEMIATFTARALRNAHRYETLRRANSDHQERERRAGLERIALLAFLRRLLDRYATSADHLWAETLLGRASDEELDRLTSVAMQVLAEEARGFAG
ncbi:MAG TPA: GAF domain-containing protein [Gemmatimonadaceae bacterium]